MIKRILSVAVLAALVSACDVSQPQQENTQQPVAVESTASLNIPFEKYTLANGLEVVLHQDHSDPIVAINLAVHVGSAREVAGRTGFAHLFEHLLFMDSENLGYGGLDEMNTRIGGEGTNGFTTHDMTQYFQAVPSDALEKVIWAEADKLGWFIKTVTEDVVTNEKQVVKNEKRQRVDNRPYGHWNAIASETLYPSDHPYSWTVIGSLADLEAATLADVHQFYKRWYVPNNVTLTITGDFETEQTKAWVEKYFGEIPKGDAIEAMKPRASVLDENISLYHEDSFAKAPRLILAWPTVEQTHEDSAALQILTTYLTDGKKAPLNKVLIDDKKVTTSLSMFNYEKEIAGELYLFVDANPDGDLTALQASVFDALGEFEQQGVTDADLERIKAQLEVNFYQQLQSVLGKAIQLGENNLFSGDPGQLSKQIEQLQQVTTEDVVRVYNQYIKDKHYLSLSFVPKGQVELVVQNSQKANVAEEQVVKGAEKVAEFDPHARTFEPTASAFDRTIEPGFGEPYQLQAPTVWRDQYDNGVQVYGITSDETPLVYFSLAIDAGRDRGDVAMPAVAALTADLMNKGTALKTTAELEDAIKSLGSTINVSSGATASYISGSTLARNFDATMALVGEVLLQPRWDADEYETLIRSTRNYLVSSEGNPNYIAGREASKLRYPADHIWHHPAYGSLDQLETVSLDDLKAFYGEFFKPSRAKLRVVGDIDANDVDKAMAKVSASWQGESAAAPSLAQAADIKQSAIYFYDVPSAKQSVLNISKPSISALDADLVQAQAMNYLLGGVYTSALMTELRVNKGYTYGIRSGFNASLDRGTFSIGSSVRTNVTLESLQLIKQIVSGYGPAYTDEKLATLKSALLRGQALKNESLSDKLNMLSKIAAYGYSDDYMAQQAKQIESMTLEQAKQIADKYFTVDSMQYVIVGDAETQLEGLEALGYGKPELLNPSQEPANDD